MELEVKVGVELVGNTRVGFLYLPDGKIIKFAVNGLVRSGLKNENPYVDEYMFKQYEEVTSRVRYLKIKPNDVFLDVGACIGSWSIHAAVYGAKVHAFEVGKPHISTLLLNSKLNNVQNNIHVHKFAVYSKDNIELAYTGWMHIYEKPSNENSITTVNSITLDTWVEQHRDELPYINYIKIDVEGMEFEVLRGAYYTIREFEPKLIVEIHDAENNLLRYDIEKFLTDLGYKHERVNGLNDYFYKK